MKKFLLVLSITACTKTSPQNSDEVLLTVTNECLCRISFYQNGDIITTVLFDCEYVRVISLRIPAGDYSIIAESYDGRKKEISFEKKSNSQTLDIEF